MADRGFHFRVRVAPRWDAVHEVIKARMVARGYTPSDPSLAASYCQALLLAGTRMHSSNRSDLRFDIFGEVRGQIGPITFYPGATRLAGPFVFPFRSPLPDEWYAEERDADADLRVLFGGGRLGFRSAVPGCRDILADFDLLPALDSLAFGRPGSLSIPAFEIDPTWAPEITLRHEYVTVTVETSSFGS